MFPTTLIMADQATRDHVMSARPDAPTVPDRPPRARRADSMRTAAALVLRRLADRVEPRRVETCQPAS
jgi:hypothetical protein